MIKSHGCILLLSLLALLSCGGGREEAGEYVFPKFDWEERREFELITPELAPLSRVGDLAVYGDYLAVVSLDLRDGGFLHLIDKRTGERVGSTAAYGRGPGELLSTPQMRISGHECNLYDRVAQKTQVYDLDALLAGEPSFLRTRPSHLLWHSPTGVFEQEDRAVALTNRSPLATALYQEDARLVLETESDTFEYDEYPIDDLERTWFMYMTPYMAVSPDFDRLAVVPAHGGIVERFELSEDGIRLLGVDRFMAPDFEVKNGERVFSDERPLPTCFSGLAASEERIFAGMVDEDIPPRGRPGLSAIPVLAVFDWSGRALYRARTSVRQIESVAYDASENTVYASVCDDDGRRYLGKMKLPE